MGAGEEVVVALVVPGCDRAELFDFVEEALNVGAAIQEGAEGRMPLAVRHRSYVRPDSARREFDPKRVGIMAQSASSTLPSPMLPNVSAVLRRSCAWQSVSLSLIGKGTRSTPGGRPAPDRRPLVAHRGTLRFKSPFLCDVLWSWKPSAHPLQKTRYKAPGSSAEQRARCATSTVGSFINPHDWFTRTLTTLSRPSPDHPVAKLMPWAADVRAQRLP